ncbi:MAG: UDP-N-acetylglucosamine 2-epimerase [Planctomycetota bacterium]
MIGPNWSGAENADASLSRAGEQSGQVRIAVVTGSRAEFGLLRPVMQAIAERAELELLVIAAGSHLVLPALTFREVKAEFEVADSVPMQVAGRIGRLEDAESLGKGIARFARSFGHLRPDWVVVLGDRIEAFAAAAAASVGGIALAHLHGGDLAEGVADDAMRHAITKLAHLHLPATLDAAARLRRMGEDEDTIEVVGSPAIDDLHTIPELDEAPFQELGSPEIVLLQHPIGRSDEREEAVASACFEASRNVSEGTAGEPPRRVLWLGPNLDPGRDGILRAQRAAEGLPNVTVREHLTRDTFVGLLKRLAAPLAGGGGFLVGNSSSALIEAQAIGVPAINVGRRQGVGPSARQRGSGVVDAETETREAVAEAIGRALAIRRDEIQHPFGDGHAGRRAAQAIAAAGRGVSLRKRWVV